MRIAVMQPYLFPYIGYFQLMHSVDRFIVYDDVAFIKQGWINRNYIMASGKSHLFTLPLEKISSHKLINETDIDKRVYRSWYQKFIKTLVGSYGKTPQFNKVFPLLKVVFETQEPSLNGILLHSLKAVAHYLDIKTEIYISSQRFTNQHLKGQERIIDICRQEGARSYYNMVGGKALYNKLDFETAGIDLKFIRPKNVSYSTCLPDEAAAHLSIIDLLMVASPEKIRKLLDAYELE